VTVRRFSPDRVDVRYKAPNSPVTAADLAVDEVLRQELPRPGEGWLSEETADTRVRLDCRRVWIVDPLDGTREFLGGIPEWSISIGLAEDGVAVAGGIYNPSSDEMYLGALDTGTTLNGRAVTASQRRSLDGAVVLVGRWGRRRWPWQRHPFEARPVGAVAYALASVAAGAADALWSRSAKAEWDVAAGTALITGAGGMVTTWDGEPYRFNRWPPRGPGLVATGPNLLPAVRALLDAR
jgi:myo-inositol-1(or 4)-monophosphatase